MRRGDGERRRKVPADSGFSKQVQLNPSKRKIVWKSLMRELYIIQFKDMAIYGRSANGIT